jgi:hypothetical protein
MDKPDSHAYDDLKEFLEPGEVVQVLKLGGWHTGNYNNPNIVPENIQDKYLTLEQAAPHMFGWSYNKGFGSAECYDSIIWTDKRVISVHEYDGSTHLISVPRNPT